MPGGGGWSRPGDVARMQEVEDTPVLMRYLRIFWRWKHIVLASVAALFVIGVVVTLFMTPQYTATTTIEIARESDKVVKIQGVETESNSADLEFYQTQYGLLKSRSLAERVARELKLYDDPEFFKELKEPLKDVTFGPDGKPLLDPGQRNKRIRKAGEVLLKHVDISPIRLSRLVEVSFTSPDPALSAKVANAWSANFIESNLERRFQATSYARKFLEGRLGQLRQKLEESERLLVGYATNQQIINLPAGSADGSASSGERSLISDDLTSLNAQLADATAERIKAASQLEESKKGARGAVSEALQNPAIAGMRQRRADVSADYAKMLTQFEPGYPAARALASQIAQLDASIAREEARVQGSFQTNYREALGRENRLKAQVDELKSSLLDLRRRSIQYNIYQRDVDTNRQLYDGLLQRYKEIGVAGGVGTNNVSVVDVADVPDRPSSPRILINLLVSILAGLAIGSGLVFALEQIDETITDPADVERTLETPLLGTVPKLEGRTPAEALSDRKSAMLEAYLAVQTNLEFSSDHGVPHSLSITSTRPAEGKSTSAFAIALSLSRAKRRVVLIDGDLRSPSVHRVLGMSNDRGFSNLLAGSDDFDAALRATSHEHLSVMTSGPLPPNAAELLTGDRLEYILQALLTRFDNVVIDSPPVMGLADAPLIASRVEGTVFVVEAHGIRTRLVRVALGRLANAHAHILGALLTKFDSKQAHFGYGYEYGYGYGRTRTSDDAV